MMTRRDVVTGSLFGTLATSAASPPVEQSMNTVGMEKGLTAIKDELERIREVLDEGLVGPSLSPGRVGKVRGALEQYLRTNGRFPDYLEIGMAVFMDIYDWHVRYQQPIQLNRTTDNRMVMRFMLTQLILRHEQDGNFVGPPFDRSA